MRGVGNVLERSTGGAMPVHRGGLGKPTIPENLLKPNRKLTSTEQAVS